MVPEQSILSVPVIWRGNKFLLELNSEASLQELGEELQKLTEVKADTMKLIFPQSSKTVSRLLVPFSDEHASLRLQDVGIVEGKPLRMMGVTKGEVDQVLKDAKAKLRIAGFEEEEKRMKERMSRGSQISLKLPQGPYVFCDFRTLEIPGVKLTPPPSEALKRMHMLAADPGIVAIMNKHHWRVGIMTEMAPVGYVGVSPVCLLGLNKNHGEEISLRLRTDDLKGFRKYQHIKKTLLHELAHMVYSEHDANFYALDSQLNKEAFALDWTRSRGHTLVDTRFSGHDDLDMDLELESSLPQKLGGETSVMAANAREASVAAAYHRLEDYSTISEVSPAQIRDSDYYAAESHGTLKKEELNLGNEHEGCSNPDELEPDPDDSVVIETMNLERYSEVNEGIPKDYQPDFHDIEMRAVGANAEEPDPDVLKVSENGMAVDTVLVDSQTMHIENNAKSMISTSEEPNPDDIEARSNVVDLSTPNTINDSVGDHQWLRSVDVELDPSRPQEVDIGQTPDSEIIDVMTNEPDPDDEELRRIQDPVTAFCTRLGKAIETLRNEVNPAEAMVVQQTLFKIIRNVSENPNDVKYKKLRKANPAFQRSIANYKAALEVLHLIGFSEEVVTDEMGKTEVYLVLKRNDPGLLWLAKSTLETAGAT